MKMCPEDKNHEGTIKAVYVDKQSKKVMEILQNLTNRLIEGFTGIINNLGNNKIYSCDINKYRQLQELEDYINFEILSDIYCETILSAIKVKINKFPNNQMNDSKLVKTYSQILLKNLNNSLIQTISKLIEDKLKYFFTEIYKLSVMTNFQIKLETNPIIVEPSSDKIENPKTIDSFIDTLSMEKQDFNRLVKLHMIYFKTEFNPITPRGLGMILSKTNRFMKTFSFVNSKKITLYHKL